MEKFEWPRDTVFVNYPSPFTLLRIVMELHNYGFVFVVDPKSQTIAMAEHAAVALGLDVVTEGI